MPNQWGNHPSFWSSPWMFGLPSSVSGKQKEMLHYTSAYNTVWKRQGENKESEIERASYEKLSYSKCYPITFDVLCVQTVLVNVTLTETRVALQSEAPGGPGCHSCSAWVLVAGWRQTGPWLAGSLPAVHRPHLQLKYTLCTLELLYWVIEHYIIQYYNIIYYIVLYYIIYYL